MTELDRSFHVHAHRHTYFYLRFNVSYWLHDPVWSLLAEGLTSNNNANFDCLFRINATLLRVLWHCEWQASWSSPLNGGLTAGLSTVCFDRVCLCVKDNKGFLPVLHVSMYALACVEMELRPRWSMANIASPAWAVPSVELASSGSDSLVQQLTTVCEHVRNTSSCSSVTSMVEKRWDEWDFLHCFYLLFYPGSLSA